MYIEVRYFRPNGELQYEETIFPGTPEPSIINHDAIVELIGKHNNQSIYCYEAVDRARDMSVHRLVIKNPLSLEIKY